ncbi:MAG: molecular chaperone [Thaumarchaeota archaeon 13_1_40CM_4_38_7]|nr:MAG: molecular chaperone [Thaumarchaeota archaeon 13_1_40CM_4_38_7]OLC92150.1 MAG: molecular chaperone [Thaumarchaeota archaeon 13_1_40CM_3_38_6]
MEFDEFDSLFRRMMRPFKELDEMWDEMKTEENVQTFGPYYYGYSMTVGPDGKPVVKEYGNIRPGLLPTAETREPLVDVIVDDKEKLLKLIAEMPGVEKKDIKIEVVGQTVNIDAEHNDRKYHTKVPVKHKVDEDSVKAAYANGILEVSFKLKEEERPKGKTVSVE